MEDNISTNYYRVAEAIEYLAVNFKERPALEEVAKKMNLSPFHFQRIFTEWAGTSPKKFLQYLSLDHAKSLLKNNETTLFNTAFETGLSGTGRLHDLFIKIEGMTPGEYKLGGKGLLINYSFSETCFGRVTTASTPKGICFMAFSEEKEKSLYELKRQFPNALYSEFQNDLHRDAIKFLIGKKDSAQIKLHVKGSPFQLKVWEALLKIPGGMVSTYGKVADEIKSAGASRAVGNAIGSNPVAYLIPCHRVIQSTGLIGGYMWGPLRKKLILAREASCLNN